MELLFSLGLVLRIPLSLELLGLVLGPVMEPFMGLGPIMGMGSFLGLVLGLGSIVGMGWSRLGSWLGSRLGRPRMGRCFPTRQLHS